MNIKCLRRPADRPKHEYKVSPCVHMFSCDAQVCRPWIMTFCVDNKIVVFYNRIMARLSQYWDRILFTLHYVGGQWYSHEIKNACAEFRLAIIHLHTFSIFLSRSNYISNHHTMTIKHLLTRHHDHALNVLIKMYIGLFNSMEKVCSSLDIQNGGSFGFPYLVIIIKKAISTKL